MQGRNILQVLVCSIAFPAGAENRLAFFPEIRVKSVVQHSASKRLTVAISRARRRLHGVVRRHSFVTSMFYTAEIGALANDSQLCMFIVPFYPQRRQVFISQLILNLVIYKLVLEFDCLDIYTIIINKLSK